MEDREIIKKIKNGEINYYSLIVKKFTKTIYLFINKKIFDKTEVDDLVQNTLINFYKAINRFDETRPILPYLYQIAQNEMKMYFRAKKQTIPLDDSLKYEETNDFFKDDFQRLFDKLTKEQREALELLTKGYSYQDISEKLNKPINTIKTLIRRGRLYIKKYEKV